MHTKQEILTGRTHNKLYDLGFSKWSDAFKDLQCLISEEDDTGQHSSGFEIIDNKSVGLMSPMHGAMSEYKINVDFRAIQFEEGLTIIIVVKHTFDFRSMKLIKTLEYHSDDDGQTWNIGKVSHVTTM